MCSVKGHLIYFIVIKEDSPPASLVKHSVATMFKYTN
jgi:hypothetical protein